MCLNCAALVAKTCWRASCSATSRARSPAPRERKIGKFEAAAQGHADARRNRRDEPRASRPSSCACWKGIRSSASAAAKPVKVDVRVIAATNRDLERDVAEGRFRRDLYFRLHVLEIVVPPLRKRPEDIPELAHYFLQQFNAETGRKMRGFTPQAMELMRKYRWPGNVRELKNVVERAVVLCRGEFIEQDDLMLSQAVHRRRHGRHARRAGRSSSPASLADMERQHILATLEATGWNKSQTAGAAGHRALDAGPQDPPLRAGRAAAPHGPVRP